MKKLFLALLIAIFLPTLPALAQTIQPCGDPTIGCQGTITSSASGGDAVQLWNAWGSQWSTVRFKVVSAGTATATLQVTSDGLNWVAAPYAKRVSTATANPTTQAITATTLTTGDVWEVALPGNNYGVQVLCAGTGTPTTISIYGFQRYVPGVPVVATLYDVTSAVNTDNSTGTLELSGWRVVMLYYKAGGATTVAVTANHLPFDGANVDGPYTLIAAATGGKSCLNRDSSNNSASNNLSNRMVFDVAAVASQQTRLVLEAYR